jgi:hypothetical protein
MLSNNQDTGIVLGLYRYPDGINVFVLSYVGILGTLGIVDFILLRSVPRVPLVPQGYSKNHLYFFS